MKIQTLLDQTGRCMTSSDAEALASTLRTALVNTPSFASIGLQHDKDADDAWAGGPNSDTYVEFTLHRHYSDIFLTAFKVMIEDERLTVNIDTCFVRGNVGLHGNFIEHEDLVSAFLTAGPEDTVETFAAEIRQKAISHHAWLFEKLGMPASFVAESVQKLW